MFQEALLDHFSAGLFTTNNGSVHEVIYLYNVLQVSVVPSELKIIYCRIMGDGSGQGMNSKRQSRRISHDQAANQTACF